MYNHQHINELLDLEIYTAYNFDDNLCLMMLDIDLFKNVNDTFGHQIGDRVLVTLSNLIEDGVRKIDFVGRYGGEEFIIVLPQIKLDDAYEIADKIRLSIQGYDFGLENLKVTISIGLAQYREESSNSFVNRADNLLYKAKENGRNRIQIN